MSVWDRVYAAEFHRQAVAYVGLRNARLPLSSRQLNEQPYQSVCGVIVLDDVVAGILATAAAKAVGPLARSVRPGGGCELDE